MKKAILAALCALIMLAGCLPAVAEEENIQEADGFRFVLLEDGNAILLEYISEAVSRREPNATVRNVLLNSRIDRHPIVDIRQNPFYVAENDFTMTCSASVLPGHRTLASVDNVVFVIASHKLSIYPTYVAQETYAAPEDTLIIGAYAFACAASLQSVTLPEGLTAIETGAFRNCTALTELNIPASVTDIAEDAFAGCENLVLTVTQGTPGEAFAEAQHLVYRYAE